jgi:hypothetical protein
MAESSMFAEDSVSSGGLHHHRQVRVRLPDLSLHPDCLLSLVFPWPWFRVLP